VRKSSHNQMTDIIATPQHALNLKVFSIHTPYVDLIRQGIKRHELRSYCPGVLPGDWCIVYETKPAQHIATVFKAKGYWCLPSELAWERHGPELGIKQDVFEDYFNGKRAAFGIEIETVRSFEPITYEALRDAFRFNPPQGVVRWGRNQIHKRILDAIKD
jgi:predicted transcriptional regulator